MNPDTYPIPMAPSWRDYLTLCKPRVVLLMLLTAISGMYLATQDEFPVALCTIAVVGIALVSGSAATFNHIIDHRIDALMDRTKKRPLPTHKIPIKSAVVFGIILASLGSIILYLFVNTLTAVLTLLSAIGYAVFYTLYLKRATPQNIVIGGLSGAMPPLLGWTSVTGQLDAQGWLLVLIIFTWTPPHFWALSLYRLEEYKKVAIPMLPVTHGIFYTKLHILFYSALTLASSLLPYAIGMSGRLYFVSALLLGAGLLIYAFKLQFAHSDSEAEIALKTFKYSLVYLTFLFVLLLLDHHLLIN